MSKNIAHRGFSGKYPENSMLAFQKAYEAGCDGVEMDVHLTRDHVIVIMHDEDIARTTNGKGLIKDYTYEELRAFDASAEFRGMYGFTPIPTLKEYCTWAKNLPLLTNIELKNSVYYYDGLEEAVIRMLREYGMENRVILSSFNNASILKCRKLAPEIVCGFLMEGCIGNAGAYAASMDVPCIHPEWRALSEEEIASAKQHGIQINTWIVNEEAEMRRLARLGVDGIITNFPDRCKKVLAER